MSYLIDGAVDEEFARLMVVVAAATNTQLTEARIRAYAQDLGDVPFEALKVAFLKARRETNFFPSLAEIRRQIGPSADDAALIAWTALGNAASAAGAYASIEVEDGAAAEALLAVFGSWPEFCELKEGPALALKRQEFLAFYRSARRTNAARRRLPGLCEASGSYPGDGLESRVFAATILRDGKVVPHRDRARELRAADQRALGEGEG